MYVPKAKCKSIDLSYNKPAKQHELVVVWSNGHKRAFSCTLDPRDIRLMLLDVAMQIDSDMTEGLI